MQWIAPPNVPATGIDFAATVSILLAFLNLLLAAITTLGLVKYFIEPLYIAKQLRRKYATALCIACTELQAQLVEIRDALNQQGPGHTGIPDALMKIPRYDSGGRIDWFTKDGYYTSITAYKIASVSSWLAIYKRGLLFSPYVRSRQFLSGLYNASNKVAWAFGNNTIFWRDYFLSLGTRLIETNDSETIQPISFSSYCDKVHSDQDFRYYFEQVHMFLWSVSKYRDTKSIDAVLEALIVLNDYLKQENIIEGLVIEPVKTIPDLWKQTHEALKQ